MNSSEHLTELKKYKTKNPLVKKLLSRFIYDVSKTLSSLNLKTNSKILDAGCGNGFLMKELKKNSSLTKFYGLDILKDSISYAKKLNPDSRFFVGNVTDMPFKDDYFDLIICSEVIEHLKNPETALKEIQRTTKKYAIICLPYEPFFTIANLLRLKYLKTLGNYPGHIHKFGKQSLCNTLKKYFNKIKIKSSTFWLIALCEK